MSKSVIFRCLVVVLMLVLFALPFYIVEQNLNNKLNKKYAISFFTGGTSNPLNYHNQPDVSAKIQLKSNLIKASLLGYVLNK